ncbi:hypothetical protein NG42_20815 [Winslowiella iniecta]|uniref:Uncharacterized protein n=1 Tax=Winslowiella iniecta TaxID=1560201 RepID=A0A0L7TIL4_9GAMM|nr:hypothetical protein NG42_20815 [Winslowiella iniecta]KOC95096.1 hypothetical protein NG43_02570 [Winslowiella iniecta]
MISQSTAMHIAQEFAARYETGWSDRLSWAVRKNVNTEPCWAVVMITACIAKLHPKEQTPVVLFTLYISMVTRQCLGYEYSSNKKRVFCPYDS